MFGIGLKVNKLLAIGKMPNYSRNLFSGQATMFAAFIDYLKEYDYEVSIIDLTLKSDTTKVGTISLIKYWEYIHIVFASIFQFIMNKNTTVYLTTAQTKGGFLRDLFFINIATVFNCPIYAQQFGSNFKNFYTSQKAPLQKRIFTTFNKCKKIIVEGNLTKQQFLDLNFTEDKLVVVQNGLPEKSIPLNISPKNHTSGSPFRLLYLSYLIESKGYLDVLHAMDILVNIKKLNVECIFSGKFMLSEDDERFSTIQEYRNYVDFFITQNNLTKSITFYEGLFGESKKDSFLRANVFILPTYFKFEGQPVSVLEAMAYGCVPIVTEHSMIPDMVDQSCALFVNPKKPEEIANSIDTLISNPELYTSKSKSCISRYLKDFTLIEYCKKMRSIIF